MLGSWSDTVNISRAVNVQFLWRRVGGKFIIMSPSTNIQLIVPGRALFSPAQPDIWPV